MIFWNSEIALASLEIVIMLWWAFWLGMLFYWSLLPRWDVEVSSWVVASSDEATSEDDLQLIEWITPTVEAYLHKQQIFSYKDIMSHSVEELEDLLIHGPAKLAKLIPTTWPDQAKLADKKRWSELEEYQEIMKKSKKQKKK